jgi:hypothetical protein
VVATPFVIPAEPTDTPEWRFRQAFECMQWQEAASVKSKLYWPVAAGTETSAGQADAQDSEVYVHAEGDFRWERIYDREWIHARDNLRDFHLRFTLEQPGLAGPAEAEVVAHQSRIVKDTLGTALKVYRSVAEWRGDIENETKNAGMAMFISLALTGGRLTEDLFGAWFWFWPGEVAETHETGPDGRRVTVFEAERVNRKTRDSEEWKVWLDSAGRPSRIELTIDSRDPARSVRDAELEITYPETS